MASESQLDLPEAIATAEPAEVESCPRCRKPLIDPAGLGWCKACGYCRSLEDQQSNQLLQAEAGPSKAALAVAGVAGKIPAWFWLLVLGIGTLALASLVAARALPAGQGLPRALWTTGQIAVGLLLIFVGQLWALVKVAPEDETLSFKDVLMPTRLWVQVSKRASRLYGCLLTSIWGLTIVVFALVFVGGLNHWFSYLPSSSKNAATVNSRR